MTAKERMTVHLANIRQRMAEMDAKLHKHEQDIAYNALKDQAFNIRHSLILLGIAENDQCSVSGFTVLQIKFEIG